MKRKLTKILSGALAAMLLAGCGSAFDDGSSSSTTGTTNSSSGAEAGTAASSGGEAASAGEAGSVSPAGNIIRIPEADEFPTVDCQKDSAYYVVPLNIYDRLIECETVDGQATLVPGLAESWDISEDGLVYTFHLRDDVTFHNGEKFEADDVVYTIDRMMNPETGAVNTDFFSMIKGAMDRFDGKADSVEGVKALDEHTVEITLDAPFAPFLANLATPSCSIYNREATEAAGDKFGIDPELTIGSGPFKMKDWVLNDKITLVRNDDYFKGAPSLDGIELIQVPDEQTQKLMYENGELDIVDLSSFISQLDFFLENDQYKDNIVRGTEAGTYFYLFNQAMAPMDDVRVRKAVQMSIDRQTILEQLYRGEGVVVNSFIPNGFAGSYEAEEIPYDPEAAKALLAEAGYADGCDIELYQKTEDSDAMALNQVVQSMLEQVGFHVTIKQMDDAAYTASRKEGEIGLQRAVWWADYNDPDNFLYTFFSAKNTKVRSTNHTDQKVFDLLDAGRVETDNEKRMEMYKEADTALVQEDAAFVPLFQMNHIVAVQDWVEGFSISWNGWTDVSYYNVSVKQ
ncbi:MAG: ABC transporter substrate-binding protein [Lachnospiraceae bacterium]|nr:ABC transporter substrate-binding protein [Lachnospiraceae bacterium]